MINETYSVYSPMVCNRVLNGMHTVGADDGIYKEKDSVLLRENTNTVSVKNVYTLM